MAFNWGAAAAGIGAGLVTGNPLVGVGVYGAMSSAQAMADTNKTNVDLTRETNAQSIELANTAHQREIKDLAAAGLNPILSAKYGGSSTPGLTTPQVQSLSSTYQTSADSIRDSMLSHQSLLADIAVKKSQVLANSAQAVKTGAEARIAAKDADIAESTFESRRKTAKNKADIESQEESWRLNRSPVLRYYGLQAKDLLNTFNPIKGWGR